MALTKKQLDHLEQRLLDERARALKALGLFDQLTQADRDSSDSDLSAYTDHMADQGTEAQEREHQRLRQHKVSVFVVDSVEDGKAMVDMMVMGC